MKRAFFEKMENFFYFTSSLLIAIVLGLAIGMGAYLILDFLISSHEALNIHL